MQYLELLAPARNMEIGIAAIDCGADAVYIAGPDFGARKAAGNDFKDIAGLCSYAHQFGAKIFVTYNIKVRDNELEDLHAQMLKSQEAGADAFIIRDPVIAGWKDITVPLHASTQCAIRDVAAARYYESIGCSRIILERELAIDAVREICSSVSCEVEFFVHGALCVCYSGECRLSEYISGKSADRGECVQPCRSLYDLVDENGKVLLHNKAVLSLKDFNLKNRLEDLAEAGVSSFKIEGRLKNESYVKNVVRDYDLALNTLIAKYPEKYARPSFGRIAGGFVPDTAKTFNRGYTELYLGGSRGKWSSMDAPKSMGEIIGRTGRITRSENRTMCISVIPLQKGLELHNGDGFAFITREGITGFRGDVCEGMKITCKDVPDLREGTDLYRNINSAFEKVLETQRCRREIPVSLSVTIHGKYVVDILAVSQDGREIPDSFNTDVDTAENSRRAEDMLREQLSKRSGIYSFNLDSLTVNTKGGSLPLLSASTINSMRRLVAGDLDNIPCHSIPLLNVAERGGASSGPDGVKDDELLMRTRYCVRYELGLCPRLQGGVPPRHLYLVNNGLRLALNFNCAECEMTVTAAGPASSDGHVTSVRK